MINHHRTAKQGQRFDLDCDHFGLEQVGREPVRAAQAQATQLQAHDRPQLEGQVVFYGDTTAKSGGGPVGQAGAVPVPVQVLQCQHRHQQQHKQGGDSR